MKIDRHNYEEFFLLYLDNELSIEDKKQVEAFVKENPDLEEEFLMFQQSKLIADDSIVFDAKETLMKEEDSFINMANYEEWLVLYADNELTASEKAAVEKFAAQHPHVKEELALFEKTILQPEKIVFANKEILYRKEEKVRVVVMRWWKVAVAAVLILGIGFTTYSVLNNDKASVDPTSDNGNGVAVNTDNSKSGSNSKNSSTTTVDTKNDETESKVTPAIKDEAPQQNSLAAENIKKIDKKKYNNNKENNSNSSLAKQDDKKTVKPDENAIAQNTIDNNNTTNTTATPEVETRTLLTNVASIDNTRPSAMQQQNINGSIVTTVKLETPNEVDRGAVASNNDKNSKLRGFFRKATRFIQRTTKINPANDDERVLIGGMAINLK